MAWQNFLTEQQLVTWQSYLTEQLVAWQSFWRPEALVWLCFSWVRRVAQTNRSSASCSPVDKIKFSATPTRVIIVGTGYHELARPGWVDSFYYAPMILSGEGPPPDPQAITGAALLHLRLFAGFYALFSGVTFIPMVGVLSLPFRGALPA